MWGEQKSWRRQIYGRHGFVLDLTSAKMARRKLEEVLKLPS
jgi:hypothetical protein